MSHPRSYRLSRRLRAATAAALLGFGTAAAAQDNVPAPASAPDRIATELGGDSLTIGAGGAYLPDYEGSNDYRFAPGPAVIGTVKGFSFTVIGNRASIDLIPDEPGPVVDFELGPIASINFNRSSRSQIDDPRVAALPRRKIAVEVGGYVGIGKTGVITSPYDKISLSLSYRQDVSGIHRSGILEPAINYLTPLSTKAAIGLTASAQHTGQGYADAYFGVTPADSMASGLPSYRAQSGWKSYQVGGFATYALTGNLLHGFKLVAGGTYNRLLGDYAASPVVRTAGSPNQWLGAVGLAYSF